MKKQNKKKTLTSLKIKASKLRLGDQYFMVKINKEPEFDTHFQLNCRVWDKEARNYYKKTRMAQHLFKTLEEALEWVKRRKEKSVVMFNDQTPTGVMMNWLDKRRGWVAGEIVENVERQEEIITIRLSKREYEIAKMMEMGYRGPDIALHLNIAQNTVGVTIRNIYHKVGVPTSKNWYTLVKEIVDRGLLELTKKAGKY